jgi:hypothetical protein
VTDDALWVSYVNTVVDITPPGEPGLRIHPVPIGEVGRDHCDSLRRYLSYLLGPKRFGVVRAVLLVNLGCRTFCGDR